MNTKVFCCIALALFCAASGEPESRIAGGTPTTIQEFPAVVAVVYHYPRPNIYIQRCVGALISSWHVLTTTFCFTGGNLENVHIRAGSTYSLSGGELVRAREVISHPDYVQTPRQADIAVVVLEYPLRITENINILFLPAAGTFIPDGLQSKAVSWGFETDDGPQHDSLKSVSLTKVSLAQCQKSFENVDEIDINDGVLCAATEGAGICFGDSGAPLIHENVIIGVSSFYKDCGNSDFPDVFTRVDKHTEWIMSVAVAPTGETPARRAVAY